VVLQLQPVVLLITKTRASIDLAVLTAVVVCILIHWVVVIAQLAKNAVLAMLLNAPFLAQVNLH